MHQLTSKTYRILKTKDTLPSAVDSRAADRTVLQGWFATQARRGRIYQALMHSPASAQLLCDEARDDSKIIPIADRASTTWNTETVLSIHINNPLQLLWQHGDKYPTEHRVVPAELDRLSPCIISPPGRIESQ